MKVEFLIYIYGAVCVSMIVFNIIYNLLLKNSESRMEKRCWKMRRKIDAQISRLSEGKNVEEAHLQELRRKLSHINQLMAFHQVLQQDMEKKPDLYREYRHQMRPVVIYMAAVYRDKENMQAGYFAGLRGEKQSLLSFQCAASPVPFCNAGNRGKSPPHC